MEPEIARRCQSCGAAVRGRAHFCPQCGRPMGDGGGAAAAGGDERGRQSAPNLGAHVTGQHELTGEAERAALAMSDKLAAAPGRETREIVAAAVEATPAAETESAPVAAGVAGESPEGEAWGVNESARGAGVLGRAAGVGARAGEGLRPGVDRLRGSLAAFDEASSDDPGLRFVVVAGLLFLVFLLLWLFGYVLG